MPTELEEDHRCFLPGVTLHHPRLAHHSRASPACRMQSWRRGANYGTLICNKSTQTLILPQGDETIKRQQNRSVLAEAQIPKKVCTLHGTPHTLLLFLPILTHLPDSWRLQRPAAVQIPWSSIFIPDPLSESLSSSSFKTSSTCKAYPAFLSSNIITSYIPISIFAWVCEKQHKHL